jgi:hypothetical protein
MSDFVYVLFFSKFSESCINLLKKLESFPDIKNNLASVCVDNKKVREKVSKPGDLQISKLPCIMKVYETTGKVEQFEGELAFSIFKEKIDVEEQKDKTSPIEFIDSIEAEDSKNLTLKKNEIPSRGIVSKQDAITNIANQMQKEREELFPVKS